eukprot:1160275-Pelagomonas_calceolata.AAC.1
MASSNLTLLLMHSQSQDGQQQEDNTAGSNASCHKGTPFASTHVGSEGGYKGGSARPASILVPQPGEGIAGPDAEPGVDGSSPRALPHSSSDQELVPCIKNMPEQPLALLRRLVDLMKVLVGQLRELCLHVSLGQTAMDAAQILNHACRMGVCGGPAKGALPACASGASCDKCCYACFLNLACVMEVLAGQLQEPRIMTWLCSEEWDLFADVELESRVWA